MDDYCSTRSVQATLISCLVTLAVSFTSWWGDPSFLEYKNIFIVAFLEKNEVFIVKLNSCVKAVIVTLVWPLMPLLHRLSHAMRVASVLRRLSGDDPNNTPTAANCKAFYRKIRNWFRRASKVGMMSVCPTIIPIPPVPQTPDQIDSMVNTIRWMVQHKWCEIVDSNRVEGIRPVVMKAGKSYQQPDKPSSSADQCPVVMKPRQSSSSADERPGESSSNADEMKGYYDFGNIMMTGFETATAAATDQHRDVHYANYRYLYFSSSPHVSKCGMTLLTLGLVPPYEQLRFLRARSRFQALVTFLQTLGFMVGLVLRLVQGLGVSPLEALICYYAIMALLNLGWDFFACTSFETTLFLSLSPHEFRRFLQSMEDGRDRLEHVRLGSGRTVSIVSTVYSLVIGAAGTGYCVHYWHLASWATRLVFPLFTLWVIIIPLCMGAFYVLSERLTVGCRVNVGSLSIGLVYFCLYASLYLSLLASVAVPVVAFVGTVIDWELFKEATAQNAVVWSVLKWIFPHISAN